jgi:hypothetical protein
MAHRVDEGLIVTLKRVASILKQADVPFALGGSFAVYAHGGHSSDHDVDFLLRKQDVERALEALTEAGFTAERPPEDWLVKVYDEGRLVDLIYRPVECPVTDETLADTVIRPVNAIHMPVLSATALMVHKLLSFSQHYCDFARGLPLARSLREQIDWRRVREETAQSPYAEAFLILLDRLGVVSLPESGGSEEDTRTSHADRPADGAGPAGTLPPGAGPDALGAGPERTPVAGGGEEVAAGATREQAAANNGAAA